MESQIEYWIQAEPFVQRHRDVLYVCSMQGTCTHGEQHGEWCCWQMISSVPHDRQEVIDINQSSGGILRVSKGNKEMLRGRKTEGLYQLDSSVQTEGGRRDGATTNHKVTYFAANLGGKVWALRYGSAYTSMESKVAR
ncbi:hypothetical protein Acr_00g0028230 [Actinidia rufa]|uniref:Uncharacterized protein n=1 Tax=Actinidia rufa TaxID=165716 RepID=A0A7J0DG30_9ERIC|nr:hypothetical protein Acr_00g0028230 [Actinidia rufa]